MRRLSGIYLIRRTIQKEVAGIIRIMIINQNIVRTNGSSGSAARGFEPTHDVNNYE